MKIKNLCNHPLNIQTPEGEDIVIPPSGTVAKVSVEEKQTFATFKGKKIPIITFQYNHLVGVPPPREGVVYVVPAVVKNACLDRYDVVAPYKLIVDNKTRKVIGARGFRTNG